MKVWFSCAGLVFLLLACRTDSAVPSVRRDGLGRAVPLAAVPRRIVTLAPSATESLLALGFGERLVGAGNFCRLPDELSALPRVGGLLNPDLEIIRSLHPDLLVGTTSGNDPGLAGQAEALELPLYILHTPDVARMLSALEDLADVLGDRDRGRQVAEALRKRLDQVHDRVAGRPRPRVLFIIWGDPLIVPGADAFLTDAVSRAGGASVTAGVRGMHPTYSLEAAIGSAPEVIVMTPDNRSLSRRLLNDPAWAGVPAVRAGRVFLVGEGVVQPGPGVVTGIEEMSRLFYPEAAAGRGAAGKD